MSECPNCERQKQRVELWRQEAYRLSERQWVGLTNDDYAKIKQDVDIHDWPYAVAIKLKEKNT